ncbi:MAG: hypothetical protein JNL90_21475 [Planctomycetes bacterium]|nr:hypothetical protein [Planctomycetota bacterium]
MTTATAPAGAKERLRFDNLEQHLLLKNGNYLYKVPFRGGFAVLKVYQGSRTWFDYALKTCGNVLVCNQTSFMPRARRRTELDCLKLWREAGFRVFGLYEDVEVEGIDPTLWALYEYVPRPKLVDLLGKGEIPLAERLALWRNFLPIWHRRHALAVSRAEPRLVHENGDLKHIMVLEDGGYLQFDFEMVFRSKSRVKEFVAREILSFLKSLGKTVGEHDFPAFMEETVRHYPDHDLLRYTHAFAFANPNPILRLARAIDRRIKPRAQKPFSKYNVARRLEHALDGR